MAQPPKELLLLPAGLSLTLVGAIGEILSAALPGVLLGVSTGAGIAATVEPPEGMPADVVAGHLVAAAQLLAEAAPPPTEVDRVALGYTLNAMEPHPEGGLTVRTGAVDEADLQAREFAVEVIAAFAPYFATHPEAANYVEYDARHPERPWERWRLTVVKPSGKTPHQMRQAAEADLAELRARVEQLLVSCDRIDQDGSRMPRAVSTGRIREVLGGG